MSWMVTTAGTRDMSGIMPLVKCATSASTSRIAVTASVCIQTSRGARRDGVAIRTPGGSGDVVSIARFEITISSSFDTTCARWWSRCSV